MDEVWVSITDAAAHLTEQGDIVDRSTLSRYLKQHGDALELRRSGKSNLVDLNALTQHRRENIRIQPARGPQSLHMATAPHPQTRRVPGSQSDGQARKVQADAEMRELDLALRRRQLTPVTEVDQAGRDSVALMQSAFERAIDTEAASLSVRYGWDERTVRLALQQFCRRGLDVFNREILDRLDAMRRARDADVDGDTPTREATQAAGSLQ